MTDTWVILMYFGDTELGIVMYCGAAMAVIGLIFAIFYRKNEDQKFFAYLFLGGGVFTVVYPLIILYRILNYPVR